MSLVGMNRLTWYNQSEILMFVVLLTIFGNKFGMLLTVVGNNLQPVQKSEQKKKTRNQVLLV